MIKYENRRKRCRVLVEGKLETREKRKERV